MKLYYRTCIDHDRGYFTDFNPDYFGKASDGETEFLSHHAVYLDQSFYQYIGCIFRYSSSTPWHCRLAGAIESKILGFDFDKAVDRLVEWRESDRAYWAQEYSQKVNLKEIVKEAA